MAPPTRHRVPVPVTSRVRARVGAASRGSAAAAGAALRAPPVRRLVSADADGFVEKNRGLVGGGRGAGGCEPEKEAFGWSKDEHAGSSYLGGVLTLGIFSCPKLMNNCKSVCKIYSTHHMYILYILDPPAASHESCC